MKYKSLAQQFLVEIFSPMSSYAHSIEHEAKHGHHFWNSSFDIGDNEYLFSGVLNPEGVLDIAFTKNGNYSRYTPVNQEDTKELYHVFSHLVTFVSSILSSSYRKHIRILKFTAEGGYASRKKLYTHLARRFAQQLHGHVEIDDVYEEPIYYIYLPQHEMFSPRPISPDLEDSENLSASEWGKTLHLPSGIYTIQIWGVNDELHLFFKKDSSFMRTDKWYSSPQHTKDLIIVISTVGSLVWRVLQQYPNHFRSILFTASEEEKIPLYTKLAMMLAKQVHGNFSTSGIWGGFFKITF